MKTGLFFLFTVLVLKSIPSFSQESNFNTADSYFSIEKLGNVYSKDDLNSVFSGLDYCGMLNPKLSYTITLDDSSIVRIHSINQINEINIAPSCQRETDLVEEARWLIKEGILIKMVEAKHSK
jgi:hypothetical protein